MLSDVISVLLTREYLVFFLTILLAMTVYVTAIAANEYLNLDKRRT